jgi:hypothetical protein
VNGALQAEYIDESHDVETEPIREFVPPPFGDSKPEDFNILYHVRLQKPKALAPPPEEKKSGK